MQPKTKERLQITGAIIFCLAVLFGIIFLVAWAEAGQPQYGEILRTYKITRVVNGRKVECLSIVYSQGDSDEGTKIWCQGKEVQP